MNIFVYEHQTGGGLGAQAGDASAVRSGESLVRALLDDLLRLPDVNIRLWRDERLPELPYQGFDDLRIQLRRVREFDRDVWCGDVEAADAVWLVAPEAGGLLESLSATVMRLGKILLGCSPKAIRMCSSRSSTLAALSAVGIDVAQAVAVDQQPDWASPCVLQSDDGNDHQAHWLFPDSKAAMAFYRQSLGSRPMALQRFVEGESCSVSMFCQGGSARVLSINSQNLVVQDSRLVCQSVLVNGFTPRTQRLAAMLPAMAEMVIAAIPGLWGFVEIEFVIGAHGPLVVAVNPGLTESYVGLYQALGVNLAELTLELVPTRNTSAGHAPIQPWASAQPQQSALN